MTSRQRWFPLLTAVLGISIAAPTARGLAQAPSSPINDLLIRAKDALNDLKFARADTIAREVLALGTSLRRSQSVLAWEIVAAAKFPEEGAARDTLGARAALRNAIRLDLDASLPTDLRFPALEALLADEKRGSTGMAVRLNRVETIYGGSAGDAVIRVAAAQPSDISLFARSGEGTEIVLDSATNTKEASLRLRALRGGVPVLPTGAYDLVVRARELQSGIVLERVMQAWVTATSLALVPIPPPLDRSKLLPEIHKVNRVGGIAAGIVVGAIAIAVNSALRAESPVKKAGADGRAAFVGVTLAAGTAAAVWYDKGEVLSGNKAANAKFVQDTQKNIAEANAENERRFAAYRAKVTILIEDK